MILRCILFSLVVVVLLMSAVSCSSGKDGQGSELAISEDSNPAVFSETEIQENPLLIASQGLQAGVPDIVSMVRPAVVSIAVLGRQSDFFFGSRVSTQSGTGFFIRSDGHVVTNHHVIEGAERIQVTTDQFSSYEATIVGADPATDLAILKVESDETFPTIPFAEPSTVRVGEWVIAIGNALGLPGGPTVTVGVVGALDRTLQTEFMSLSDLVQTDAAINSGNSGGPLVNLKGEVVGINTVIITGAQGIGFSLGTFTAIPVTRSILEFGRVIWPWLGVSVNDVSTQLALELELPARKGVHIVSVVAGSPAEKSGVQSGDVVLSMGDSDVNSVRELQALMRDQLIVGDQTTVRIWRDGSSKELRVTLEEMPRERS